MQRPGEKVFKIFYQVVSVNFVGINKNKTSNKLRKVIIKIGITSMLLLQNLCWFCFLKCCLCFTKNKSTTCSICSKNVCLECISVIYDLDDIVVCNECQKQQEEIKNFFHET